MSCTALVEDAVMMRVVTGDADLAMLDSSERLSRFFFGSVVSAMKSVIPTATYMYYQ